MSDVYPDADGYDTLGVAQPLDWDAYDPLGVSKPAAGVQPRTATRGWTALTLTLRRKVPGHLGWSQRYRREMDRLAGRGSRIR